MQQEVLRLAACAATNVGNNNATPDIVTNMVTAVRYHHTESSALSGTFCPGNRQTPDSTSDQKIRIMHYNAPLQRTLFIVHNTHCQDDHDHDDDAVVASEVPVALRRDPNRLVSLTWAMRLPNCIARLVARAAVTNPK
jgi:hypothetical protein